MWYWFVVLCQVSLWAVFSLQFVYIWSCIPHRQLYLCNTFDGNLHAAMACVLSAVAAAFSGVPEEFCVNPHQTFESLSLVSALVQIFSGPAVFPFDLFPIFAQQHWYFYSGFNIPGLCERFRIINVPWPFQGLVTWILFIFLSRCFGRAIDRWYETKWVSDALFTFLFFWVVCCFSIFFLRLFPFLFALAVKKMNAFFGRLLYPSTHVSSDIFGSQALITCMGFATFVRLFG